MTDREWKRWLSRGFLIAFQVLVPVAIAGTITVVIMVFFGKGLRVVEAPIVEFGVGTIVSMVALFAFVLWSIKYLPGRVGGGRRG